MREIALLGGSFNPPHVAHVMAAYWALATQAVDEVWLVPTFQHPFGKTLLPFEMRVEMCELAVRDLDRTRVRVSSVERELAQDPLVGRTARTLEHLVGANADCRFTMVIGSDVLAEAHKWYRWDRVTELARIVVIDRAGEAGAATPLLPAISSSAIRDMLRRGADVSAFVPRQVVRYIAEHRLFAGS